MGMSASQARFLGLTARKTNVEFEGQQINQQRTTLSNQSANYYNDLLGMAVPVPPSVDDYTKAVYTFEDGALTNQITAMIAQNDGTYTVSYLRTWKDDFSMVSATTSIVTTTDKTNDNAFKVGSATLRKLGEINDAEVELTEDEIKKVSYYMYDKDAETITEYQKNDDGTYSPLVDGKLDPDPNKAVNEDKLITAIYENDEVTIVTKNADGKYVKQADKDAYLSTFSDDQLKNLMKEEEQYLSLLRKKYGDGDYMVRYVQNTTTGEYEPYFYKLDNLKNANYDANGNSQSNINCYKIGTETKTEEVKAVKDCKIEKDSSGRYINITIPDATGKEVTYALTTSTATDQAAYDDAMNQYEYEKYEYDQAIQEINSKIEIVQSEDKNLELRLKQLDTEQDAISTEIDAVQKVIEKNVESSFKTFG